MNHPEQDGLSPENLHPIPPEQRRHLGLYLLPIVLFPILLLLAAFLIVPTRWFIMHSGNTYMANIGYADTLTNSNCQVLIYGDSTALTAVDPAIIQAHTGLKTCNLAEFEGMTAVNGTLLVDRYLTRNPRPRFIVFLYTPDDLRIPEHWNKVSSFEAVTYRIQHGLDPATLKLLAAHPADTLGWAEQGMRMSLFRFRTRPMDPSKTNIREPYDGQLRLTGTASLSCDKEHRKEAPDLTWLHDLRNRYGVHGTQVLIDATPIPACDPDLAFFERVLPGVVDDDPLPIYPIGVYLKDTRLHMTRAGSEMVSQMIAVQVFNRLHSTPSAPPVPGRL